MPRAVLAGGVALATVGANSVDSGSIVNDSIRSVDIKDNNVRSNDIQDGTVASADIANNSVKGVDIKHGTITSIDIRNGTIKGTDLADTAKPAGVASAEGNQSFLLTSTAQSIRSVVLDAPAAGHVIVTASGYATLVSNDLDHLLCTITDGAIATDSSHEIAANDLGISASQAQVPLSGTRTFAVPAGPTTFRLVCRESAGSVAIFDSQITALYVPQLYAP